MVAAAGGLGPGASGAPRSGPDDSVRLNQIQVIGSHNSYHLMPSPAEDELRRSVIGAADDQLEYAHAPLPQQFGSQKVRQIELDVWVDSAGGLYSNPLLRNAAGLGPWDSAMSQPGIKVFHIQDVDYNATCLTLIACLTQVKGWSDTNPGHVPIAILLELKDTPLNVSGFTFVTPEPWTTAAMDGLDAEIRSVFSPSDMITPDDVRGSHASLSEAVTTDGWPTLGQSRGKVMFLMDNEGGYRTSYLAGHPALAGRVIFTNSVPGAADAAFLKRNDPTDPSIPGLVAQGYVVRTRSDGDTTEARANNTAPRDAALASGAQWVSTDYPVPGMAIGFTSPYYAEVPGGQVARCNPINGPANCTNVGLDLVRPVQVPITTTTTTAPKPTTTTAAPRVTTTTSAATRPANPPAAKPAKAVSSNPRYTG